MAGGQWRVRISAVRQKAAIPFCLFGFVVSTCRQLKSRNAGQSATPSSQMAGRSARFDPIPWVQVWSRYRQACSCVRLPPTLAQKLTLKVLGIRRRLDVYSFPIGLAHNVLMPTQRLEGKGDLMKNSVLAPRRGLDMVSSGQLHWGVLALVCFLVLSSQSVRPK